MKKNWGGNRKKTFYSEMWETLFEGGGICGNPVGLSMYDSPLETVQHIWVNIWSILDWILSCRLL